MSASVSGVVSVRRMVPCEVDGAPVEIAVRPFRIFGDMQVLGDLLPKLGPFLDRMAAGDFVSALAEAGEPCLQMVILSTRMDADAIVALDAEAQLALLAATFEVNANFFAQKLAPMLTTMVTQLLPTPPTGRGAAPSFQDMTIPPAKPTMETEMSGPTPPPA